MEYKRGKALSQGPRLSEKVQLCAQGLALRENGWKSNRGYLYYSGSKQRIEIVFDDELDVLSTHLVTNVIERNIGGFYHVTPHSTSRGCQRGDETDLDRTGCSCGQRNQSSGQWVA